MQEAGVIDRRIKRRAFREEWGRVEGCGVGWGVSVGEVPTRQALPAAGGMGQVGAVGAGSNGMEEGDL